MLSNKHQRHHSLSLKMGFGQGQRKALSPPRYLTRVWTPRVSVWRRGACSCHRGSSLFTGPSSSEKSRERFSAGGHKSQAGEQQVWGCSGVGFCGGVWITEEEEEEDVGGNWESGYYSKEKGKED